MFGHDKECDCAVCEDIQKRNDYLKCQKTALQQILSDRNVEIAQLKAENERLEKELDSVTAEAFLKLSVADRNIELRIAEAIRQTAEDELNACIEVATEALTREGMDMTSVLYILGNLSTRKAIRAKYLKEKGQNELPDR